MVVYTLCKHTVSISVEIQIISTNSELKQIFPSYSNRIFSIHLLLDNSIISYNFKMYFIFNTKKMFQPPTFLKRLSGLAHANILRNMKDREFDPKAKL